MNGQNISALMSLIKDCFGVDYAPSEVEVLQLNNKYENFHAVLLSLKQYISEGYKLSDSDLFAFHPNYTGDLWENLSLKKAA
jgi:hypothetical protein